MANVLLVMAGAWLVQCITSKDGHGFLEQLVRASVYAVTGIVGAGLLLSLAGILSPLGFLVIHLLAIFGLVVVYGGRLAKCVSETRRQWRLMIGVMKNNRMLCLAVGTIFLFLLISGFLAMKGVPGIYDSLTYRLSRIAHWLQEGRIFFINTNDPRQNYMPFVPDLVMLWLLGGTAHGFGGVALCQWGGGIIMLLSTVGLARAAGLGRLSSMGAALLTLGMGNVAVQFTTTQTDLFTAGLLAAAVYLYVAAARRGSGSISAGLAAALALGSKGTIYYFAPSLLVWALWYAWRCNLNLRTVAPTVISALGAGLVFVFPVFFQNQLHYGHLFGPKEAILMHHQGGQGAWPKKAWLNISTSLIQSFEPHSQAAGLGSKSASAGLAMADMLPANDPFTFENYNRKKTIEAMMVRKTPDADGITMGLVVSGFFLIGSITAVFFLFRTEKHNAPEIVLLSAGVCVFLVFFHMMQQWHPFGFRYFILVAPWVGIVVAWSLERLSGWIGKLAWTGLMLYGGCVVWSVLLHTHNAAWSEVVRPERSRDSYVYLAWRMWLKELQPHGVKLHVMLPSNSALAPFYRQESNWEIVLHKIDSTAGVSAEGAAGKLGGDWLITTPRFFSGREGQVIRRDWLFQGDENSPYSLVAYRTLAPGESLSPGAAGVD